MAECSSVLAMLPQEHVNTLVAAGLSPADVISWILAHGHQGADLLRKLLPSLGLSPQVQAVITLILDILYPPTPSPVP